MFKRLTEWLFKRPETKDSAWEVLVWWEVRRIPFNIIIGVWGLVCLVVFFWAATTSGKIEPGEDPVEPLALFVAPIVINVLYTLGWLVEIPVRRVLPRLTPSFGPALLKTGIGLGVFLISLPAAFWLGYRALQFLGVLS